MTQEGNGGNAPYMSIRDMITEMRVEVRGLRKDFEDFKDTVVTKDEHSKHHKTATSNRRFMWTTVIAAMAVLVSFIGLVLAISQIP